MTSLDTPISFFTEVTRLDIVKILIPSVTSFVIGILITPLITHYMFKYRLWKKKSTTKTVDGKAATITAKLHNDEARKVPRMGGLVIVLSVLLTAALFWLPSFLTDSLWVDELNYFSRAQTWMPLLAFFGGFLIGFIDDLAVVGIINPKSSKLGQYVGGGIPLRIRIGLVALIALFCGWWFYAKLDVNPLYIPFVGALDLSNLAIPLLGTINVGWLIIPIFVIVMVGMYSGGIIDGVDGLAGGVMANIFATYGLISFLQFRFDLATLCLSVTGAILAFLWFNIAPARFFMTETGMMALTVCLSVVAFFTETVLILPIIAFPLVITSLSVSGQILSKKLRNGKKILTVSPLHNHFQANGWPGTKVTMRYWVFSQFTAIAGLIIFLLGYQQI